MKKNLFAIGLLASSFSLNAQILTYVGDGASVYIQEDALVYSGGTVQTVGAGKVDNSGNVMIDNGGFYTKNTDGSDKKDGNNFILRLRSTAAPFTPYGQLFITGAPQSQITGIVDKEYRNSNHGDYQQIAFPFYGKMASSLNTELGKTLSDKRWSQNEVLAYNNKKVRFDNFALSSQFGVTADAFTYYIVGGKSLDLANSTKVIHGVPFSDEDKNTVVKLEDAGAGIDFGSGGNKQNYFREKYNSYVQDAFEIGGKGGTAWTGTFGKNIYQFGNPFLTNLDLSNIGRAETANVTDNLNITSLYGIRVDADAASVDYTDNVGSSGGGTTNFVTFNSGVPTGAVDYLIVKPLSVFSIKLNDNNKKPTFDFKNLRRFKYVAREESTDYNVTAAKRMGANMLASTKQYASNARVNTGSTVKQLGIYALDASGNIIDKTFYVVYNKGITGKPSPDSRSIQVSAGGSNLIGTFEEKPTGGIDTSLENSYWLYINEANENDFKGKEIPLRLYDDNKLVKSLKFEIRENAKLVSDNSSTLTNGESFYFLNQNGSPVAIKQNQVVPVTSADVGLFYGKPLTDVLADNPVINKPSSTAVVLDNSDKTYKILFDKDWVKANVTIYDMSGKLISEGNNVNTENPYIIQLPAKNTVYIITAVSDKGEKFVQKIKN